MKALIYKETEGQEYKYVLLYFLILGVIFSNSIEYAILSLAPTFLTISAMMSILMGDIATKNHVFICSLPITRKEFFVARYIQVIIFNTIFSIVALLIGVALHLTGFMQIGNNSINFIITSYVIVLGFAGIILPFYTLIKNTRAIVLISLIIYFLIFLGRSILEALLEILRRNVQIKNIIQGVWASEYLVAWIFAFSLVFCIASLFLSIRLYDSRDLI